MLPQVASLWPVVEESFKPYHDKVNGLLLGQLKTGERVLIRITHSLHRSLKQLETQAARNNALQAQGVHLPQYLLSNQGQYAHRVMRRARPFFVTISFFIEGKALVESNGAIEAESVYRLGQEIGRLHQAQASLSNAQLDGLLRLENEAYLSQLALTEFDQKIRKRCLRLLEEMKTFPQGVIFHQLNPANVCQQEERISVLDDDWLCRGPKAMDLLSPLYVGYGFSNVRQSYQLEPATFASSLLSGYQSMGGEAPTMDELRILMGIREIFNLSLLTILMNRKDQLEAQLLPYQSLIYQRLLQEEPALADPLLQALTN